MRPAAVLLAGGVAALALAPGALAANTGSISVTHSPFVLAGSKSTTIHVSIPQATDPIAAINIYVPAGYGATLSQSAGTTIGNVDATAFSHDAGLTLPLSGNVTADNPTSHVADSTACTGVAASAAVWILNLSVAGQTIALPLYVNPTAGAEQALGAYKLSICLPPPDVPVGTPGRSAQGAQVLDARFTVNGVVTTPAASGQAFSWRALFTPYNPGKGTVDAAGTFEARAAVPLPAKLTVTTQQKVGKTVHLTGNATAGPGALAGTPLRIAFGRSAGRLTSSKALKTNGGGGWTAVVPAGSFFQLSTTLGERPDPSGCTSAPAAAPQGCVGSTLSPFSATSALYRAKK